MRECSADELSLVVFLGKPALKCKSINRSEFKCEQSTLTSVCPPASYPVLTSPQLLRLLCLLILQVFPFLSLSPPLQASSYLPVCLLICLPVCMCVCLLLLFVCLSVVCLSSLSLYFFLSLRSLSVCQSACSIGLSLTFFVYRRERRAPVHFLLCDFLRTPPC